MSQVFDIREARPLEAPTVSALALRSKGHWGYDDAFLEACRAELTFSEEDCASGDLFVAESDGVIAGFHFLRVDGARRAEAELVALFVDPPWIGHGLGRLLLRHSLELAAARGVVEVHLEADPGAEPFYLHHGARRTGEVASGSIPGRVLPLLTFGVV